MSAETPQRQDEEIRFDQQLRDTYAAAGFVVVFQAAGYLRRIYEDGSARFVGNASFRDGVELHGEPELDGVFEAGAFCRKLSPDDIHKPVIASLLHDPFDDEPTAIVDIPPVVEATQEEHDVANKEAVGFLEDIPE